MDVGNGLSFFSLGTKVCVFLMGTRRKFNARYKIINTVQTKKRTLKLFCSVWIEEVVTVPFFIVHFCDLVSEGSPKDFIYPASRCPYLHWQKIALALTYFFVSNGSDRWRAAQHISSVKTGWQKELRALVFYKINLWMLKSIPSSEENTEVKVENFL